MVRKHPKADRVAADTEERGSRRRRPPVRLLRRLVALGCLFGIWQVLVMTSIVNPLFVASPTSIAHEFGVLWSNGTYQQDVSSSLRRVAVGFLGGSVAAIVFGYVLATYAIIEDIVDWPLQAARSISPLALVPLTVLWLGTEELQKYVLVGITVFFPVLINVYGAVRSVPEQILRGARTMNCHGAWRTFRYVIIPMSAPAVFNALRVGLAMAFLVIVAAEMIGANTGLGYLILNEGQQFNTPAVFVGIASVGFFGAVLDRTLISVKRRLCPWHVESAVT